MSATLDRIIEEVRQLPPDEQQQLREILDQQTMSKAQAERSKLSSAIRGKYADSLSGSDEFAARKAGEIALEDHRNTAAVVGRTDEG